MSGSNTNVLFPPHVQRGIVAVVPSADGATIEVILIDLASNTVVHRTPRMPSSDWPRLRDKLAQEPAMQYALDELDLSTLPIGAELPRARLFLPATPNVRALTAGQVPGTPPGEKKKDN